MILVTGAGGTVGTALVAQLKSEGRDFRACWTSFEPTGMAPGRR